MEEFKRNTFRLEELDEGFWEKAIIVNWEYSRDVDTPGHISIITTEKKEYYISFEGFPYAEDDLGSFADVFRTMKGWKSSGAANGLVRESYYNAFEEAFQETCAEREYTYFNMLKAAGKLLELDVIPEQTVYEENVRIWNERKKTYDYYLEKKERNKLTAEDLTWKPIHPNNLEGNGECGQYALIFAEMDERIFGMKLSVVYQMKQTEGGIETDEIEFYNLYVKIYPDVLGPLHQPEYGRDNDSILGESSNADCTFYDVEVNSYGQFERTFVTLEAAKAGALRMINRFGFIQYMDRKRVLTNLDDPIRERKGWCRYYETVAEFQDRYKEIMQVVYAFEYPDASSCGGGLILDALEKRLGIDREKGELMLSYIPMILTGRERRRVGRLLEECRRIGQDV